MSFAEENGFLPKERTCSRHKEVLTLDTTRNTFRCRKCQAGGRKGEWSRNEGTWFEQVRLDYVSMFSLLYSYAHRESYEKAVLESRVLDDAEATMVSENTVCDWYQYCRETCVSQQIRLEESTGQIGGEGIIVQIDESKFDKRKYNVGRRVEGHWVLGMIADGSEDLRLELCPDNHRSADDLIPIIQKHVAPGSIIHTDAWKAYGTLGQHGYTHRVVNHSDPDSPWVTEDGVHTQRIESQWRVVKQFFGGHRIPKDQFADHVVAYQWYRRTRYHHLDPFEELLKAVKLEYGK